MRNERNISTYRYKWAEQTNRFTKISKHRRGKFPKNIKDTLKFWGRHTGSNRDLTLPPTPSTLFQKSTNIKFLTIYQILEHLKKIPGSSTPNSKIYRKLNFLTILNLYKKIINFGNSGILFSCQVYSKYQRLNSLFREYGIGENHRFVGIEPTSLVWD